MTENVTLQSGTFGIRASLVSVLFYESTNILDGDLSPLLLHKGLTHISFQNRRHYELEIYKEDGSQIIEPPHSTKFELFSPLL